MEKNNNLNEAFLEVLAESPLFREIEKKELRAMLVCLGGQIKEYKKGTSIFRWGDTVSKSDLSKRKRARTSGNILGKGISAWTDWSW